MAKNTHIEQPTPQQVKAWKDKYGKILKYSAADGKVAYFREPDIAALDAATAIAKTSPLRSNQIVLKAAFLGGDECVISEQKYIVGIMPHVQQLIDKVEGEFSEL